MRSSPTSRYFTRRYLLFLLVITVAVLGSEQLYQLFFLNTTGRTEAQHALRLHPDLARRLGPHHFGFAWRGHNDWWTPGGGPTIVYMPVIGEHASGLLYLRESEQAGVRTLQKTSFHQDGAATWTFY